MNALLSAGAVATGAEEEDASDDEAALLFAGEAGEVEADVWASDADDEAGPSDKEDGEEEEGTAQAAHQQDRQQGDSLAEDEAPAARPPPGRRRWGTTHLTMFGSLKT